MWLDRSTCACQRTGEGALLQLTDAVRFTRVHITGIASKKLSAAEAPAYFVMAYQRRSTVMRQASGLTPAKCSVCQTADRPPLDERPRRLVTAPPLQEPLVAFANYRPGVGFCSAAVVQVAHDQQWTNARFEPSDIDRAASVTWSGIDYRSEHWRERLYPST